MAHRAGELLLAIERLRQTIQQVVEGHRQRLKLIRLLLGLEALLLQGIRTHRCQRLAKALERIQTAPNSASVDQDRHHRRQHRCQQQQPVELPLKSDRIAHIAEQMKPPRRAAPVDLFAAEHVTALVMLKQLRSHALVGSRLRLQQQPWARRQAIVVAGLRHHQAGREAIGMPPEHQVERRKIAKNPSECLRILLILAAAQQPFCPAHGLQLALIALLPEQLQIHRQQQAIPQQQRHHPGALQPALNRTRRSDRR